MRKYFVLALTALMAAGCSYSDEGEGSKTLAADVQASYVFAADSYQISMKLSKENQPVSGAEIKLTDNDTGETFNMEEVKGQEYNYQLKLDTYHRFLHLSVTKDNDKFWAQLEGPAHYIIKNPVHNGRVLYNSKKKLTVSWKPDDGSAADNTYLEFVNSEYTTSTNKDSGSIEIAMDKLKPGLEVLKVSRCNNVELAGAVKESSWTCCYDISSNFQLQEK